MTQGFEGLIRRSLCCCVRRGTESLMVWVDKINTRNFKVGKTRKAPAVCLAPRMNGITRRQPTTPAVRGLEIDPQARVGGVRIACSSVPGGKLGERQLLLLSIQVPSRLCCGVGRCVSLVGVDCCIESAVSNQQDNKNFQAHISLTSGQHEHQVCVVRTQMEHNGRFES